MLIPRKPALDLDNAAVVWSKVPEFALFFNATGAAIPNVEHFLNNVIGEVLERRGASDPALADDLARFIEQEKNHTTYHNRFNANMFKAGYGDLKPVLRQIARELSDLRRNRSLAFCTAYCAGFENAATFSAQYLLEGCEDMFEGAEPNGANLMLWHVAEEFEHRSVCHEAFNAVSGSYFLRIWGLLYAFWHINRSFARCRKVILEVYRRDMNPAELKASKRRHGKVLARQALFLLPRMLRLFLPWFDPARLPVTPGVARALNQFAGTQPIVRTPYQVAAAA